MRRRRRWRPSDGQARPRRPRGKRLDCNDLEVQAGGLGSPGQPAGGGGASPNNVMASQISALVNWRRRRRCMFVAVGGELQRDANSSEEDCRALDHLQRARRPGLRLNGADDKADSVSRLGLAKARTNSQQLLLAAAVLAWWCAVAALAASAAHVVSDEANSVIIKTHQGQLFRGLKQTAPGSGQEPPGTRDVVAFLGVRYASAPTKRLRFMPPAPFNYAKQTAAAPANNHSQIVHDMRQFGPICMQRLPMEPTRDQVEGPAGLRQTDWRTRRAELQAGLMERLLAPREYRSWQPLVRKLTSRFVQSEDCLNLNIYTPIEALKRGAAEGQPERADSANGTAETTSGAHPDRDRPVLVLVHGHSFDFGSGSALDGRAFAQNNRVVVITLNYRLHILGFPPRLASASRGNLGLLDQVAALHWIQANVRSFGGSPEKITLMGSKGGAIFVHLLMLSPLAKGLFRRAVLEDGTALSPVIANNMALAGQSNQQRQQVATAASQQHLRLLAQLNDCSTSGRTDNPGRQQATSGGKWDEERTSLASIIECLKAKPAESIMRHLPAELIDSSRPVSRGAIPLAPRWLRPLEQTLDLLIKEELRSQLDDNSNNNSDSAAAAASQQHESSRRNQLEQLKRLLAAASADQAAALLDEQQLDRLIRLLINRFLQTAPATEQAAAAAVDEDGAKLMSLLSELLGAIYLPSNKTLPVGPVFAPQLEPGLILAGPAGDELDLASLMLQRGSPFNRRDLLIGLTHPLVDFKSELQEGTLAQEDNGDTAAALALVPSLASRKLLELGLTEEQAINQVNLFVRSFYRYHQQEISNSIISQYLGRKSGGLRSTTPAVGSRPEETPGLLGAVDQQVAARLQKQLFLADAMCTLYLDSLVDVPLLKSALIHSLQQLEALADLFVAKQLDKLEAQQGEANHDEELEQQLADERWLEEEFHKFAKSFYQNAPIWPVRLVPSNRVQDANSRELFEQRQPHSTFLFQFVDKFDWLPRLRATVRRLDARAAQLPSSARLGGVRAILGKIVDELSGNISAAATVNDRAGQQFECSFISPFEEEDQEEEEEDERDASLFTLFKRWICRRRIGRKLANFIETGNVNNGLSSARDTESGANYREVLESRFEVDCIGGPTGQLKNKNDQDGPAFQQDDHHLVQLGGLAENQSHSSVDGERHRSANWRCRKRIQELAFEELAAGGPVDLGDQQNNWTIFNVFTQQLASLFAPSDRDLECSMDSLMSSPNAANSQLREAFDGKVAFWANFVTALNCSKTQPIGASSLSLFSQANSTLLNMNLNLNCQQAGGTRTANSMLQSMGARIKQELNHQVVTWRRLLAAKNKSRNQLVASLSPGQNHHSLRMANMSNNQDQQQQQQTSVLDGGSTGAELGATSESGSRTHWLMADTSDRTRKFIHQLTPVAFWLLAGGLLVAISAIVLSSFVVLRRRKRRDVKPVEIGPSGEEQLGWNSTGMQLDAGDLFDESGAGPTSGELALQSQATSFVINCNPDNQQQDNPEQFSSSQGTGNGLVPGRNYASHHNSGGILIESNHQTDGITRFMEPEASYTSDHNGRSTGSSILNAASSGGVEDRHLPDCSLILMQQHHQQLLSSSSETTTTTNTQRAQSSVSLVSNSSKRPAGKKRVKISDPRRRIADVDQTAVYGAEETPLIELDARQFQVIGSPRNYCPIHRSSSNLNLVQPSGSQHQLVIDDATKYQLLSGHHSLLRHYHDQNSGQHQRALALNDGFLDGAFAASERPHQVCAAHNFERQQQQQQQQQRQQVIFANGLYQHQTDQPETPRKNLRN